MRLPCLLLAALLATLAQSGTCSASVNGSNGSHRNHSSHNAFSSTLTSSRISGTIHTLLHHSHKPTHQRPSRRSLIRQASLPGPHPHYIATHHPAVATHSRTPTADATANGPPYSWKVCQGDLPFNTTAVTLTPDRPRHGRTMTFRISGASSVAVTGGRLHVIVYYLGWHVWSETQDLCKAVACPVQPGQVVTISNQHKLPLIAPPGAYELKFSGMSQDNAQWVCVKVAFQVGAPAPAPAAA